MSLRKKWKVVDNFTDRHMDSYAAVQRYLEQAKTEWGAGYRRRDARVITVYVDERQGHGWQLHERVNLAEFYKHGSI